MEFITVILRDGNRICNWEYAPDTPLRDVLDKWLKSYFPFEESKVWLNGAMIGPEMFGCFLSSFTEDKMEVRLRTKFPKKRKEEEED